MRKPKLTFFPAEIGGKVAAIVIDLDAAHDRTKPVRVLVRVKLQMKDKDGLRHKREIRKLEELEDALFERLTRLGARYLGFFDVAHTCTHLYQAPKKVNRAAVKTAIGDVAPYEPELEVRSDPDWSYFAELLPEDPYDTQRGWNAGVLEELERLGDDTSAVREIDHWAMFPTRPLAEKAAKALLRKGFTIDPHRGREIPFHRDDAPVDADEFTKDILDIVLPLGGEYEWGTTGVAKDAKKR